MGPLPNSPPPSDIELQCNDEQIVLFLENYSEQRILPRNVIADLNPYGHPPSNLPEGLLYLMRSGEGKELIRGLWKIKEGPLEIYSNDVITGWKIVLEYFPGHAPNEERNDWVMEEYSIKRKDFRDDDKTKDVRTLCRVFHGSEIETRNIHNAELDIGDELNFLAENIPDFGFPFGPDAVNETMGNLEEELRAIVEVDDSRNTDLDGIPRNDDYIEIDDLTPPISPRSASCGIPRNDYIEMNDLIGPISPRSESFSSQNSSCTTTTLSDEYVLVTAPAEVNNAPPELEVTSGSAANVTEVIEAPQTGSTDVKSSVGTSVAAPETKAVKREISDSKTEDTATTSDGGSSGPSQGKKTGWSRVKKLRPYFCFLF